MVIEPLLKVSSGRKRAEKFPFSFCDYSIKHGVIFNQPFRKESKLILHTSVHISSLLNTDDTAPDHMLLSQMHRLSWTIETIQKSFEQPEIYSCQLVVWEFASWRQCPQQSGKCLWPLEIREQCPLLARGPGELHGAPGRMQIWKVVLPMCFSWRKICREMLIRHPFIVSLTMVSSSTSSHSECLSEQNGPCQIVRRRRIRGSPHCLKAEGSYEGFRTPKWQKSEGASTVSQKPKSSLGFSPFVKRGPQVGLLVQEAEGEGTQQDVDGGFWGSQWDCGDSGEDSV